MADEEFVNLPLEDRCRHKLWKARMHGYTEVAKICQELMTDSKSLVWMKFMGMIREMVVDPNAFAQEKGLAAVLLFVQNYEYAGKMAGEIMDGIVQKCLAAQRASTKELAKEIILMLVEIEKQNVVIEELLKGAKHKNPKIVATCVLIITLALREFGMKVIDVKPLIEKVAALLSDRDKTVRDEAKLLAVEIFRWSGNEMKTQLASLPPWLIKELEEDFDKVRDEMPEPNRHLRTLKKKQEENTVTVHVEPENEQVAEVEEPIDPSEPIDLVCHLTDQFYATLEEKKWQDRKAPLDKLADLLKNSANVKNGDYARLVHTLVKIISNDSNVLLVALAGKCLALLANRLGKRFSCYVMSCTASLFEKFKEKKMNVVTVLRESLDEMYKSTNLEAIHEQVVSSLGSKNPNVKAETAFFLARALRRTSAKAISKKLLPVLVRALLQTLNESDAIVREHSAEALATLAAVVGDSVMQPFFEKVDQFKIARVKEWSGKIEIKPVSSKKRVSNGTTSAKSDVPKKEGGGNCGSAFAAKLISQPLKTQLIENELTDAELNEKAAELFAEKIFNGLLEPDDKKQLSSLQALLEEVANFDPATPWLAQIIIRFVCVKKPGLKGSNHQVVKMRLDVVRAVAENHPLTEGTVNLAVNKVLDKLADPKLCAVAADVLTAFAEATSLQYMVARVLCYAFEQKSAKVQTETLNWVNNAILEFGFHLQSKLLVQDVRNALQSADCSVRNAAISLLGTMYLYVGSVLMMLFEDQKPELKKQIQSEFDSKEGYKPPKPIRGLEKSSTDEELHADQNDVSEQLPTDTDIDALVSPVDISPKITTKLLEDISHKDWKIRREALTEVQALITEAVQIKPTIGELAYTLNDRLRGDTNVNIVLATFAICEQLAKAMGSECRTLTRTFSAQFLRGLGDGKAAVRTAALSCINAFANNGGYRELFEGERIADALKNGHPTAKLLLWNWLAERLPTMPPKAIPKEDLNAIVPVLYDQLFDKNPDVRKVANDTVVGVMLHLGYETMLKAVDKVKSSSRNDIEAILERERTYLPEKTLPKGKSKAFIAENAPKSPDTWKSPRVYNLDPLKTVRSRISCLAESKRVKTGTLIDLGEDELLMTLNDMKSQRISDEKTGRVAKWTFFDSRPEFTTLLREQMMAANFNEELVNNLVDTDFRCHLDALACLSKDLNSNSDALICNLDLIFKWLTLRFHETNPSVLIKALEYASQIFEVLIEKEYELTEYEGSSFVPHLLIKFGDSKEATRQAVRGLMQQLLHIYPSEKLFDHLIDAVRSKNSRQRTECLNQLAILIEKYGLMVCEATGKSAFREIASYIADRDNSVRNAALNCIVEAYYMVEDNVFKLIGHLNSKELTLLDERIKRAKKAVTHLPIDRNKTGSDMDSYDEEDLPECDEQFEESEQEYYSAGSSQHKPGSDAYKRNQHHQRTESAEYVEETSDSRIENKSDQYHQRGNSCDSQNEQRARIANTKRDQSVSCIYPISSTNRNCCLTTSSSSADFEFEKPDVNVKCKDNKARSMGNLLTKATQTSVAP